MSEAEKNNVDTLQRRVLLPDAKEEMRKELIDTIKLLEGAKNKLKQMLSR